MASIAESKRAKMTENKQYCLCITNISILKPEQWLSCSDSDFQRSLRPTNMLALTDFLQTPAFAMPSVEKAPTSILKVSMTLSKVTQVLILPGLYVITCILEKGPRSRGTIHRFKCLQINTKEMSTPPKNCNTRKKKYTSRVGRAKGQQKKRGNN